MTATRTSSLSLYHRLAEEAASRPEMTPEEHMAAENLRQLSLEVTLLRTLEGVDGAYARVDAGAGAQSGGPHGKQ